MAEQQPTLTGFENFKQKSRAVQGTLEVIAKAVIVFFVLGSMFIFGKAADPALAHPERKVEFADRILSWSFVVFSVGLAELFLLFVVLSVLGKIDLAAAFYDKGPDADPPPPAPGQEASEGGEDESQPQPASPAKAPPADPAKKPSGKRRRKQDTPPVSLSRLQAFMWTLVVMTIYFHRVVKDENNGLPTIPPELLMVMGISGATYLVSKSISSSAAKPKPEET